ncbi:hypothetical protein LU631_25310 [Erwinia tracheiphila]|uniref:Uncharacterized protein n=1 Tax=Erwinia tracheiphila TaxID=65700 RepID=A0A0M2KB19_9GAMM|nr:hypothetical protein [Erwinia tracheiphila]AXF77834.1 hypothetical protein AV903_20280 [Erwinia tracheiphila]EOS93559.1 hypothetical protein ETR_18481 [Erwinia tracheiphila PSU-1]KKF36555.1 hypothetical protein SY86_15710 [Erwinia tracheiphila]UIA83462.1 hypothetical protein LU604_24885 [Erwinia tracheiphila]UIA87889.1 hypothetical protein LU631_25310 [Erwinia tracheiphila]
MTKFIFILTSVLFSPFCFSHIDEEHSNFSFHGSVYTVYIASNCDDVSVCDDVTGSFYDKKNKKDFVIKHGKTINIGYGSNLRGFVFTDKNTEFTFRQPSDGNGDDLSKWILTLSKIPSQGYFTEVGYVEFLSPVRFK